MTLARRIAAIVISLGLAAGCEVNPAFDPPGTSSAGETAANAAVAVSDLRAVWTTPNQIRWQWQAEGRGDQLLSYEIVTGPTEADVLDETAASRVWTAADNPELGRFLLPKTGGEEPVLATTTDLHLPDEVIHARLRAIDTAGRVSVSNVAAGRTTVEATGEIVVFSEQDTPGYSIPATYQLSEAQPYAGSFHYRYLSSCAGQAQCWENLRRQEMLIDLSAMSEGSYASTAFVEVAVRAQDTEPPWWSQIWVWYDGACIDCIALYDGWTLRADGDYQLVQVPLRIFHRQGTQTVPYDEVAANGLFGFSVGGNWADGATVDVDEIRIRW